MKTLNPTSAATARPTTSELLLNSTPFSQMPNSWFMPYMCVFFFLRFNMKNFEIFPWKQHYKYVLLLQHYKYVLLLLILLQLVIRIKLPMLSAHCVVEKKEQNTYRIQYMKKVSSRLLTYLHPVVSSWLYHETNKTNPPPAPVKPKMYLQSLAAS